MASEPPTGKPLQHGDEHLNRTLGSIHRSARVEDASKFTGKQVKVISMKTIREAVLALLEQAGTSAGVSAIIEELTQTRIEKDQLTNKAATLEQQLADVTAKLQAKEEEIARMSMENAHLREHGDTRIRQRLAHAEEEARQTSKRTGAIDEEQKYLKMSVESLREAIATLDKELAATRRKAEEAESSWGEERERLQAKVASGVERLKGLEAQNRTLIDAMARAEAVHLKDREEHAHELASLKAELARATGNTGQGQS